MPLSDNIILKGFLSYDTYITKEYFYGYCRRAYLVLDNKYQLHNKVGLDFLSLAHEYYLQLLSNGFRQLIDRPKSMKLSAFMFKGFWFVTMDALKVHRKNPSPLTEGSDVVLEYLRSTNKEEGMMEQVAEAVALHYKDRTMSHLAWEIFVLGYKQSEVSAELGLTPSAVNQRYKKMMEEVVTPFVIENYGDGIYQGYPDIHAETCLTMPCPDIREMRNKPYAKVCCMKEDTSLNNISTMNNKRITPEYITTLHDNEIFVFGSNLRGIHAGGAAHIAYTLFGAEMGNGVGIQGQSYAIPTMQGGVETIRPYVEDFLAYASQHPEQHFLVTAIGCGIAGFTPEDIAPLFVAARDMDNVSLPESFWEEIQ